MKTIKITKRQEWFIKCAIELSAAVLPLEDSVLSEKEFLKDYGISKSDVKKELDNLAKKLK